MLHYRHNLDTSRPIAPSVHIEPAVGRPLKLDLRQRRPTVCPFASRIPHPPTAKTSCRCERCPHPCLLRFRLVCRRGGFHPLARWSTHSTRSTPAGVSRFAPGIYRFHTINHLRLTVCTLRSPTNFGASIPDLPPFLVQLLPLLFLPNDGPFARVAALGRPASILRHLRLVITWPPFARSATVSTPRSLSFS